MSRIENIPDNPADLLAMTGCSNWLDVEADGFGFVPTGFRRGCYKKIIPLEQRSSVAQAETDKIDQSVGVMNWNVLEVIKTKHSQILFEILKTAYALKNMARTK